MEPTDTPDTILFAVSNSFVTKAGLPPMNCEDSFHARSSTVGNLHNASKIAFNLEGELFAVRNTSETAFNLYEDPFLIINPIVYLLMNLFRVRGGDLYTGSLPSAENHDWFSTARRVGKFDWNKFKFLLFDPKGMLYAVTKTGELYKGPKPDNENVSWLYGQATKIGNSGWNKFDALFFDPQGVLYAVTQDDKLVKGSPPTDPNDKWQNTSTTIGDKGWRNLAHFIAFSPEGDLWCVDSRNGNIYKGSAPADVSVSYIDNAEKLGSGYNMFPMLSFTVDKTIQSIESFEFLPDKGKILSQSTEVVQSQIYNNKKSSVPLKHTFSFTKTISQSSTNTHEHGFTVAAGTKLTFKTGIPVIAEGGEKISVDISTTHTWTFNKTNETQTTFSSSTDMTIPGGKAIRMVASVMKGEMDVPYRAKIRTLFGYETVIEGVWQGTTLYNLTVTQEDYNP